MKDTANSELKDILSSNGYSLTKPRLVVFNVLNREEPLTISQIIKLVDGKIDRASTYRTITLFEKLGILNRLSFGFKFKFELSDKFREHHHHLVCLNCGAIEEINEQTLEDFIHKAATKSGFQIQNHQLEIQGLCENCQSS
jgi:Fur family ferric uptake transcriptional regulator